MSRTNNSYDLYLASHDFQNGAWFDNSLFTDTDTDTEYLRKSTIRFPNGTSFDYTWPSTYRTRPSSVQQQVQKVELEREDSVFERLENADCIEAYAKTPLLDRRTLVLVSSTMPRENDLLGNQPIVDGSSTRYGIFTYHGSSTYYDSSTYSGSSTKPAYGNCSTSSGLPILHEGIYSCLANSSLYKVTGYGSGLVPKTLPQRSNWFSWICSQEDEYEETTVNNTIPSLCGEGYWQKMKENASTWTVGGFAIDYCISERLEHGCKLNMATSLLIVVIVFNAIV